MTTRAVYSYAPDCHCLGGPLDGTTINPRPQRHRPVIHVHWTPAQLRRGDLDAGAVYVSDERFDGQPAIPLHFRGTLEDLRR